MNSAIIVTGVIHTKIINKRFNCKRGMSPYVKPYFYFRWIIPIFTTEIERLVTMKKYISVFLTIVLLNACMPGDNPSINKEVIATSIKLNKNEITLEKNANEVLTVTFTPSNVTNKTLTWVSSNSSVATVTDGIVVGTGIGSTEIIVKNGDLTDKCRVTVVIPASFISINCNYIELYVGETFSLETSLKPSNTTDKVEWFSSNESVATVKNGLVTAISAGTGTIIAKAGAQSATCEVKVTKFVLEAIDLGLSVKWANANLGAISPEDYGDYYAWGDVETYYSRLKPMTWKEGKTGYDWSSYKWANGDYNKLTKYCPSSMADYWNGTGSPDNKTTLDPEDDPAHVLLGGNWRMPTPEELQELLFCCTSITQKGVNGWSVYGNNNRLFIPATGYWDKDICFGPGSLGVFWSSSLFDTPSCGQTCLLFFNYLGASSYCESYYFDRRIGCVIRPVTD